MSAPTAVNNTRRISILLSAGNASTKSGVARQIAATRAGAGDGATSADVNTPQLSARPPPFNLTAYSTVNVSRISTASSAASMDEADAARHHRSAGASASAFPAGLPASLSAATSLRPPYAPSLGSFDIFV